MSIKNWLQGKLEAPSEDLTADELMALDRHEEAKQMLLARLKLNAKDLHAHLKLAEAYRNLGDADSCRQEYLHVAGAYAEDGFYDRARAVLTKLSRVFPGQIDVETKMAALQRAKNLDYSRNKARAGLLSHSRLDDVRTGVMAVEFEQIWTELSRTSLVDQISSQDFTRLFESVRIRKLPTDQVVVEQGPEDRALFIVVKGSLDARAADKNGHLITLRSFGPGEIVGDTVLFKHYPWPAQYHCDKESTLLELDGDGVAFLIEGESDSGRLLDVLRGQGNDEIVRRAVAHLKK